LSVLILTRRVGENVIVGDDIVISVIEVRGDAVRIGIQAPRSVTVHREEVYVELQKANEQAASSSDAAVGAAVEELLAGDPPVGDKLAGDVIAGDKLADGKPADNKE
jgi:carbon storage regulator